MLYTFTVEGPNLVTQPPPMVYGVWSCTICRYRFPSNCSSTRSNMARCSVAGAWRWSNALRLRATWTRGAGGHPRTDSDFWIHSTIETRRAHAGGLAQHPMPSGPNGRAGNRDHQGASERNVGTLDSPAENTPLCVNRQESPSCITLLSAAIARPTFAEHFLARRPSMVMKAMRVQVCLWKPRPQRRTQRQPLCARRGQR